VQSNKFSYTHPRRPSRAGVYSISGEPEPMSHQPIHIAQTKGSWTWGTIGTWAAVVALLLNVVVTLLPAKYAQTPQERPAPDVAILDQLQRMDAKLAPLPDSLAHVSASVSGIDKRMSVIAKRQSSSSAEATVRTAAITAMDAQIVELTKTITELRDVLEYLKREMLNLAVVQATPETTSRNTQERVREPAQQKQQ